MHVYKILMQQRKLSNYLINEPSLWNKLSDNKDYYVSKSGDVFAVIYDVEKFKEKRDELTIIFSQRYISQLILTNYKFFVLLQFVERLNLKLVDITYKNKMDEESESAMFRKASLLKDDNNIKEIQRLFKENRIEIKSISFRCINNEKQLVKINSNGTMTTVDSSEDFSRLIPCLIDFLFKGPVSL